jgi:hypothetical protein
MLGEDGRAIHPSMNGNSIEDLVEDEGNEYPVADLSRINTSNELNEVCKEVFKEYFKKELIEILMEEMQEKFKGNIQ